MALATFFGWQGGDIDNRMRVRLVPFLDGFVIVDDMPGGEVKVLAPVFIELDKRLHPDVVRFLFDKALERYEQFYSRREAEAAELLEELELD